MEILVMGGSYFLGKHFVSMAAEKHNVTVYNRGNRPLMNPQIVELYGDRHDRAALEKLTDRSFDAVVDFCAYKEHDIETIIEELKDSIKQYIFVSTCDVYKHGLGKMMDESSQFEDVKYGGEAGEYIEGKVALEKELVDCAMEHGVSYTSIRPAIIYGPGNYAPREEIYFNWIENAGQILHPVDATGEFQMVYVEDVARAILNALGNGEAFNKAYNLAPLPMVTYDSFADALSFAEKVDFVRVPVNTLTIMEKQIPLPFPLFKEESNWYDGSRALQLIGSYTTLSDGLKQTIINRIKEE
ncbi:MAG: NAD-dependent epimerase/dehydratase family protein [Wujia sp.]